MSLFSTTLSGTLDVMRRFPTTFFFPIPFIANGQDILPMNNDIFVFSPLNCLVDLSDFSYASEFCK